VNYAFFNYNIINSSMRSISDLRNIFICQAFKSDSSDYNNLFLVCDIILSIQARDIFLSKREDSFIMFIFTNFSPLYKQEDHKQKEIHTQ
jgi:hypothetical protein